MKKINLKKDLKEFYNPSDKNCAFVDMPEMKFLMIDGCGDPNTSQEFQDAVEALYAVSYALKFMVKKGSLKLDYGVMPLEGLWWADDMRVFQGDDKSNWKFTLMIMQPDIISNEMFTEAVATVRHKRNPVALDKIRLENFNEGKTAQIMHIGPFSEEGPTIEKLHGFIADNKFQLTGKHHEIYLSDIRRAAPEKWKTILRQPICTGN